jgi:hypothetical protein
MAVNEQATRGGETPLHVPPPDDDFEVGFLIGILVGEGHFGGDGRQPQVTLRMHADHRALFEWLVARFPDSRLYGPYEHSGRRYYQWMARGPFLRERLLPILRARLRPEHSGRVWARFVAMCRDYGLGEPDPGGRSARSRRSVS